MENKYQVTVAGTTLFISTNEKQSYVNELASTLSDEIKAVLSAKNVPLSSAVMVCALDILDRYKKTEMSCANMRNQVRDYIAETSAAKALHAEAAASLAELEEQFSIYRKEHENDLLASKCAELDAALADAKNEADTLSSHNSELQSSVAALQYREQQLTASLGEARARAERLEGAAKRADECERSLADVQALYDGMKLMNDELVDRIGVLAEKNEKLQEQLTLLESMIDEERSADIVEDSYPPEEKEFTEKIEIDSDMFSHTAQIPVIKEAPPMYSEPETDEPSIDIDRSPAERPAEPDAYSAQQQVKDLFSSVNKMDKPPFEPSDSDMPDLEWTKDL